MKKLFIIRYLSCFAFGLCLLIGSSSFVGQKNVSSECVNTIWFDLEGNIGPYKVFMHVDYDAEVGEKCGYYYYKDKPNNQFSLVMAQRESALAGCKMTIKEYTSKGVHSGTFKGYFSTRGINFSGTFTNTRSKKQFKFELLEAL